MARTTCIRHRAVFDFAISSGLTECNQADVAHDMHHHLHFTPSTSAKRYACHITAWSGSRPIARAAESHGRRAWFCGCCFLNCTANPSSRGRDQNPAMWLTGYTSLITQFTDRVYIRSSHALLMIEYSGGLAVGGRAESTTRGHRGMWARGKAVEGMLFVVRTEWLPLVDVT
jgi:hypothetical protein